MAVAGVRTTKGLYFTFTLLCLVCLASSLIDKQELEKLKENLLKIQQQQDRLKEEYESEMATSLGHINEYMNIMEQMAALVKKTHSSDDLPPVEGLLQNVKGFMEKTKAYIEREKEELGAKIEENDKKVGKMNKFVEFLEENQAEL